MKESRPLKVSCLVLSLIVLDSGQTSTSSGQTPELPLPPALPVPKPFPASHGEKWKKHQAPSRNSILMAEQFKGKNELEPPERPASASIPLPNKPRHQRSRSADDGRLDVRKEDHLPVVRDTWSSNASVDPPSGGGFRPRSRAASWGSSNPR